jgi:hypothetical protein
MLGDIEKFGNFFVSLPQYVQVLLPAGYVAYIISQLGLNRKSEPLQILFSSAAFAILGMVFFKFFLQIIHFINYYTNILSLISLEFKNILRVILLFFSTILVAILWRKYFFSYVMCLFRKIGLSNSNQYPNVWTEITDNPNVGYTQVVVNLKNGNSFSSDFIYDFNDSPINLMRVDNERNIGIYVTSQKTKDSKFYRDVKQQPVLLDNSGQKLYRLTYFFRDEIESVEFLINKPQ